MGPDLLKLRLATGIALIMALAGCAPWGEAPSEETVPGTRLDIAEGSMAVPAWLPDGHVYLIWSPSLDSGPEIWRVAPGQRAERVDLPAKDGCRRTDYLLPHRLPDGRLGLARDCIMEDPEESHIDLVAYDPARRQLEMLAPLGKDNPNAVSWRKDLQSGYVSHGSGICDGIAPLTRQGPQRFPRPLTVDGHTWRLEEVFFQAGNADCTNQGRADAALLTPDELRLVFLASPESQGHSGQVRLDEPWNLYIQDLPDDSEPRALVRGFSDTRGMAISPDGEHVAIAGRRGDEQGLWLVDLDTGDMRKLAGVRFSGPAFSPDGRQLAVILTSDIERAQLYVLDMPAG